MEDANCSSVMMLHYLLSVGTIFEFQGLTQGLLCRVKQPGRQDDQPGCQQAPGWPGGQEADHGHQHQASCLLLYLDQVTLLRYTPAGPALGLCASCCARLVAFILLQHCLLSCTFQAGSACTACSVLFLLALHDGAVAGLYASWIRRCMSHKYSTSK